MHDVGALWRSRQWRLLLNLIDHLPQNTWYQAAVNEDPEHAAMVLAARDKAKKAGEPDPAPAKPSLAIWSPEVDKLATLIDEVRALQAILIRVNNGNAKDPKPVARPGNAMESARLRTRQAEHDAMKARLLPNTTE
jgi:hypothetical protein